MDAGGLQRLLAGSFARTDPEIEVRVESSVERPRRTGVQGSRRLGSSRRSVLRSRRTKNAQDAADRYPSIVKRLETLGLADASVDWSGNIRVTGMTVFGQLVLNGLRQEALPELRSDCRKLCFGTRPRITKLAGGSRRVETLGGRLRRCDAGQRTIVRSIRGLRVVRCLKLATTALTAMSLKRWLPQRQSKSWSSWARTSARTASRS